MMLQSKDKKTKIYFYFFLFLLITTFYNSKLIFFLNEKFKVTYIETQKDKLVDIELKTLLNKNIFNIDKETLNEIFLKKPILKSFEIKKIYPNKLEIILIKSEPIAKIFLNNNIFFLGDNGKLFNDEDNNKSIPDIIGGTNLEEINNLIQIINNSYFKMNEIKIIKIYPSKRFDFIFRNNKIIKFPLKSDYETIEYAYLIYKNKDFKKNIIDLRLKNKVIISNE